MPFENKYRLENTSSASGDATAKKRQRTDNALSPHSNTGYDALSYKERMEKAGRYDYNPSRKESHKPAVGYEGEFQEKTRSGSDSEYTHAMHLSGNAGYYDAYYANFGSIHGDAQQSETDAGPSQEREVVELTDQQKHDIIIKGLNSIATKVGNARANQTEGYNKDSHFIQNYRVVAKYRQLSSRDYPDIKKVKEAYEALEEMRKEYYAGNYNTWEDECCQAMGI